MIETNSAEQLIEKLAPKIMELRKLFEQVLKDGGLIKKGTEIVIDPLLHRISDLTESIDQLLKPFGLDMVTLFSPRQKDTN